jgi:hypothetical protein
MIVKGSFDPETRRPYCQGLLFIPRLKKASPIDFIVDTGSDVTTLNPGDGKRMEVDYTRLIYSEPAIAVGSRHNAAVLQAIIAFASNEGNLPIYSIQLHITPYSEISEKLPSMLGTDILHRWKMNWNPSEDILEFTIISCDKILPGGLFGNP